MMFSLLIYSMTATALDFSSTPEDVMKILGKPGKVKKDDLIGFMKWVYPKGEIVFLHREIIAFEQTKGSLSIDLGKRKEGVFLKFGMEESRIPEALGAPSRVETEPDARDFSLWYFEDLPAPDGKGAVVAVYMKKVLSWSVGDKKNYYICHLWEKGKDKPETPVQKRVMKKVGAPSALLRAVKEGRLEYTRYIFRMEKSGIYQIEFRGDFPDGYRVLNPEERPVLLEKLSSIHPPKSAGMTRREVRDLARPPEKVVEKKPVWERFRCKGCR